MLLLCFIQTVHADEHVIDLALIDKNLTSYHYQPSVYTQAVEINVNGINRSYHVYVPNKETNKEMPVLIALHGAGRTGLSMIDTWHKVAFENNFIVIAPNGIKENWNIASDEITFIHEAISHVHNHIKIDKESIYIFGHSNGGKQAIIQAVRNPKYFKKAAVHAATLPLKAGIGAKIPQNNLSIGIFLGDSDSIFSVSSARNTVSWLSSLRVESDLYILTEHSHWYYSDAYQINNTIWNYLQQ